MAASLKITFELELADNPPLYQDLVQFPKGPRRVNRLRTLAHAGLMFQRADHPVHLMQPPSPAPNEDVNMKEATLELFGPPSDT